MDLHKNLSFLAVVAIGLLVPTHSVKAQDPEFELAQKTVKDLGGSLFYTSETADGVTDIDLNGTDATDAHFAILKPLKNLKHLRLRSTKISDTGMKNLPDFTLLEELNISSTQVSDVGIEELKNLKHLKI